MMGVLTKVILLLVITVVHFTEGVQNNDQRFMYFLCPPKFIKLGNECYYISQGRINWLDAHFECKERNSRLAEPIGKQDRFLRKYLNNLNGSENIWIGARYDWERNKWQWGYNGEDVKYQAFSQMSAGKTDLKFHCAILKSKLKYRWSASSCEQQLGYVCQHKLKIVNEKKRQNIFSKWNETYPNEKANEVIHMVSRKDLITLKERRSGLTNRAPKTDNHPKDFLYKKFLKNSHRKFNKPFHLEPFRTRGNQNNRQWRQRPKWNTQPKSNITNYASETTSISVTSTPYNSTINQMKKIKKEMPITSDYHTTNANHYDDQYVKDEKKRKYQNNADPRLYKTKNQFGNQTNEIEILLSPNETKLRKLKNLRNRLVKLTEQQKNEFFKRRAERNKKLRISSVNIVQQ